MLGANSAGWIGASVAPVPVPGATYARSVGADLGFAFEQIDGNTARDAQGRAVLRFGSGRLAPLQVRQDERAQARLAPQLQTLADLGIAGRFVGFGLGFGRQRLAVLGFRRLLRREQLPLLCFLGVGRLYNRVKVVEFLADLEQFQRRRV